MMLDRLGIRITGAATGLGVAMVIAACSGSNDHSAALPPVTYATNAAVYVKGMPVPPNAPTARGTTPAAYTVAPHLPPGLALDPSTGAITGTPAVTQPQTAYTVTASYAQGAVSGTISITVVDPPAPPVIVTQPSPARVTVGTQATFEVTATGTGSLQYQWYRNGTAIPGANGESYTTGPVAFDDGGASFTILVEDPFGGTALGGGAVLSVQGFVPTGNLGTDRNDHAATLLPDGRVLVTGGESSVGPLASAELYDPASGSFSPTGAMSTPRIRHASVLLNSGKVLVVGGSDGTWPLATAEEWDPDTGLFTTTTGSMDAMRDGIDAVALSDGRVLVSDGIPGSGRQLYDPSTRSFEPAGTTSVIRLNARMAPLADGGAVVIGGSVGGAAVRTAERYAAATKTFSATGPMSVARDGHTVVPLNSGEVLVVGGSSAAFGEVYAPGSGTFVTTGPAMSYRTRPRLTRLTDGRVLVSGGYAGAANTELYDPATLTFDPTAVMTAHFFGETATLLNDGSVLVTGGTVDGNLVRRADLWRIVP